MNRRDERQQRQSNDQEIARLRKAVDDSLQGDVSDREWAEFTRRHRNKLSHLLQEDLLAAARNQGIIIPEIYFTTPEDKYMKSTLTRDGEAWVKHEVKTQHRAEIKDWISILTPIVSSAIAILSLLVALKKK